MPFTLCCKIAINCKPTLWTLGIVANAGLKTVLGGMPDYGSQLRESLGMVNMQR